MDKTEREKFFIRLEKDREQGLVDTQFFTLNIKGKTEEDVYSELNRMDSAKAVEVFMI